jgi:diguanylate cyclase (GGDEF)-like protein
MRRADTSFVSLKTTLIVPYVLLILALTIVIGLMSYWAGSRMVSTLSERLSLEMVDRIEQAVDRHMYGSSAVLESAFPLGMPAPDDISDSLDAIRTRFWTATTLHTDPNDYVYYGNQLGQSYGLKRTGRDKAEVRYKLNPEEKRQYFAFRGIDGKQIYLRTEQSVFDPRVRPWYETGASEKSHIWTAVYVDFSSQELVVTRARKVLNEDQQLTGVVATDVSLIRLNNFISGLRVSANGRALLVERNGELLAASKTPNVRQLPDGQMQRVSISDAGDPMLRAAYENIIPLLKESPDKTDAKSLTITHDGQTVDLAFKRITDNAGLDWTAIVAVPRSDVLAGVTQQVFTVALLGLVAVLIAILLGFRILHRVATDVSSLSRAVINADHSDNTLPINLRRKDEIGMLARSFMDMRKELFTDNLTGVANRAALERFMENLLKRQENGMATEPFTVLFIDLDQFKPLNDQYGHENGDLALIEIAARLQAQIGPHDLLARYGGDEFVIVIRRNLTKAQIEEEKLRIHDALLAPLTQLNGVPMGENVYLNASIGEAQYPAHGRDIQSLLFRADHIMYQEKKIRRSPFQS